MRKFFAATISAIIFLVPLNAVAAVKVGSACTKLGATSITDGKKYTCIKSGKKLVWNKGVTVSSKPTPLGGISPTPAPTSTKVDGNFSAGNSCTTVGERINNATGYLECRAIAGIKQQYFQISNTSSPLASPSNSDPIDTCQIKDQRPVTNKYDWQEYRAISFPAKPEKGFTSSGNEKIVVVGIDFSDAQGVGTPKAVIEEITKNSSEWIDWYSNKNLKWDFYTYDKWIRAPRESQELKAAEVGADAQITDSLKSEYIKEIDKYVDLKNTAAIWVIFPESVTKIYAESQNRSYWNPVSIKNGSISPAMFAIGNETYLASRAPWLYFTHETMHAQGLMGHAPQWPYIFGLMNNEYSASHNLNAWDSLVLGWSSTQDTYCKELKKLTPITITLAPIEREQLGIKSVLIKLSESKILAIESHRVDKWSPQQIPGLYGVTAYVVNMGVDNRSNVVEPFATYLKLYDANHGVSPLRGKPIPGFENFGTYLIDGVGVASGGSTDLNVMMYLGENLIYEGVKISLISSGDNDTVKIEKTP